MTKEEVVALMRASSSEQEWTANCATVKKSCNGYPDFWYHTIILSGLGDEIAARWGGDMQIKISFGA